MRTPAAAATARAADEPPLALAGNRPLALRGAESVWQVESGAVEVFAVPRGEPGPRQHLLRVAAGGLLCGADAGSGHGLELLAVGEPGTRARRREVSSLGSRDTDSAALESWLSGLTAGLALPPAPRAALELAPGAELVIPDDSGERAARAFEGVVQVELLAGEGTLLGREGMGLEAGRPLVLPAALWLKAAAGSRLATVPLAELLGREGLGGALAELHERLLGLCALQRRSLAAAERTHQELRRQRDRSVLTGAYSRLASILRTPKGESAAPRLEGDDDLLAACRRVGAAMGVAIRDRPEGVPPGRQGERLAQICAASRIRSRRVLLRDDWWRRENGPLVAFRVPPENPKARLPVALLPTSVRGYDLYDADGNRQPLDAERAESLSGEAYMLYPALPAGPVGKGDLVRLALQGRRRDVGLLVATGAAGGLLALLVPILTGQLFGGAIPSADRSQLVQITLALLVSAAAGALFQIARSLAVLRLGTRIDGWVQAAVWDRLLSLPAGFFRRFAVGDLASRAMGLDAIRGLLTGNVLTLALSSLFSAFSFLLLFHYSVRLALLAAALVVVLLGVTAVFVWLQLRSQRAVLELQGKISSLLFGLIHGIAKLRVAGAEGRAFSRWAERFAVQRRHALAAQRRANAQTSFNALYGVLTSLAVFAFVGMDRQEPLPLGDFLAFNAAFAQVLAGALALATVFSGALPVVPIYERLRPILETPPEVDENQAEPGELSGNVELNHVSFRYQADGPSILDDVTLRAAAGEFVALVGPSGSGKSTCLRLLLGFERPGSGSIYFDSQDLSGLAAQSVRRQIGVVLQNGLLVAGSLFSNIVGSANLSLDDAWEAARAAGLEDDIRAMPMGMHTVVSEGAETFSGGQKQRLLIARAVVQKPRILLFDEATSALDNRTQEIVSRSLERLKATRIVIAHRLSTIQNADRIYVIEGGRVVEEGTYQDLLRRDGPFARLAERQIA